MLGNAGQQNKISLADYSELKAIDLPAKMQPIPTRPIFYDILYIYFNLVNQKFNTQHYKTKCRRVGLANSLEKDDYKYYDKYI
jgi:hypothetical protein